MSRLGLVCLIVFALALPASALTVNFEPNAVVANEVTPGGSAVFFAVAFDMSGGVRTRVRTAVIVRDDDGDGIVRYEPEGGVPWVGLWGVVDFTTGAAQVLSRSRGPLNNLAVRGAFRSDEGGQRFPRFAHDLSSADLLVVRPGKGAWKAAATEGGDGDTDYMADGKVVIGAGHLVPLTDGQSAPEHLLPGDVVVLIDGDEMRAGSFTLGQNH